SYINIRPGTNSSLSVASLAPGACTDFYFEVEVTRNAAAYNTTRRYRITVTADGGATTGSTPAPRELFVEKLISQSRNSVTDVQLSKDGVNYTSIPSGGTMALVVGNTYYIKLVGSTATNGYEQIENFINFPNTIFQILSVSTTYSANSAPSRVSNPHPQPYADGCLWINNPNDPNYRSCWSTGKAGGNITVTYQVKILAMPSSPLTNPETLTTLIYDFSGSSYHYNADYQVSARYAAIVSPTAATITKSFTPSTTNVNGISRLTITIKNNNPVTVSGYNLVDNLPANMKVANPPNATTSSCGSPTFAPTANATSLSFSNGTIAANGTCTIQVDVTTTTTGTFTNTTNNLFVDTQDTGKSATAQLTVNNAPPPPTPTCGLVLARWTMDTGQGTGVPPAYSFIGTGVSSATASYSGTGTSQINTAYGNPLNAWGVKGGWAQNNTGYPNGGASPYFNFTLDTSKYTNVQIAFDYKVYGNWANKANNYMYVYSSADGGTFSHIATRTGFDKNDGFANTGVITATTTGSSTTSFRINAVGQQQNDAELILDNITFTGCRVPDLPTLTKSFSPTTVAVNGTSTLTFTVTNPNNNVALSGIAFTDTLPDGLTVTTGSSSQCGGTLTTTAPKTISFANGSLAAGGSCNITVTVTATAAGPHDNVSGYIYSTQTYTNTTSSGYGKATLTALLPPSITKQFAPNPILANGTSTLTFRIINPNLNATLSNVAFSDTFPTSPGSMVVANPPNASTSGCGTPTFAPVANAGSISFSNGTIAGGGTCVVKVDVKVPNNTGTYNNTSGNVSAVVSGVTVTGNNASDSLTVKPAYPAIGILKQVSTSPSSGWVKNLAVSAGTNIYYKFTIENLGDVALNPVRIADNTLNVSSCNSGWTVPLPVAVATNENHIQTCVVGPIVTNSGVYTNTATAYGTYNGSEYNSSPSNAIYDTVRPTAVTLSRFDAYTASSSLFVPILGITGGMILGGLVLLFARRRGTRA
ncbi:MAG: DUF11 domain-containing protein, partial [Anaerolineae bacterium]|nr:DUF11 domain-containing protein [Anaerolineae bacterium]